MRITNNIYLSDPEDIIFNIGIPPFTTISFQSQKMVKFQ
jgi:hypothetical protein